MIKQNNLLREQLTPSNRSYVEDMILSLRDSRLDRVRTEELLLEATELMLKEQSKGRNAKQVFGEHPEEYFKETVAGAPARRVRSKLNFYLMVPVAALSCMFAVLGICGLLLEWAGSSSDMFSRVSVFSLIAVGGGSIVLIQLLLKWLGSLSEGDTPVRKGFDLKGLAVYIAIAVAVIFAGAFLDSLFPVITVSPWVSLVLGLAGGISLKFIFLRS
ncbi:DUF1129 family protein [Paenibacillus tengchongensis]|uniref:DUF1129 family protein n=1 Tax=Paenibacillus tengchongensis TaxID=2608684 RepID=UPI0016524670|nr:DUF1129 family protein [Paenibacillus tengchongensis]